MIVSVILLGVAEKCVSGRCLLHVHTHFWCVGMGLFKSVMSFDLFSETKAEHHALSLSCLRERTCSWMEQNNSGFCLQERERIEIKTSPGKNTEIKTFPGSLFTDSWGRED